MRLPRSVTVVEVGPRDGLQDLKTSVPTGDERRWIRLPLAAIAGPSATAGAGR